MKTTANDNLTAGQIESLRDAEVAVRNAMVHCATVPQYPVLAQMQRKLLKLLRDADKIRYT